MDGTIAEQELAQRLTEMLDRVRLRGERLTIDRAGEPIAVLAPVGQPVTWRTVEGLGGEGTPIPQKYYWALTQWARKMVLPDACDCGRMANHGTAVPRRANRAIPASPSLSPGEH